MIALLLLVVSEVPATAKPAPARVEPLPLPDEKKSVDVVCPVDGHKFSAWEITSTNQWGGVDRDGCPHAFKTRPLELYVWCCPKCKFAGSKKDFAATYTDAQKKTLSEGLKPPVTVRVGMKQTDIPGWAKYDLYAQSRALLEALPEESGKIYLRAAWCWRQEGVTYFDEFDEWEKLWSSYGLAKAPLDLGKKNRSEFELEIAKKVEKDLAANRHKGLNLQLARYLAAYLFRRHGENESALTWIAELDKMKGENSIVDDAVSAMKKSIDEERRYQKLVLAQYEKCFAAAQLEKKTLAEVAYLIGELQRRLGDKKAASGWYAKALELTADETLKKMATEQKALCE